jgi:hypothetical protein
VFLTMPGLRRPLTSTPLLTCGLVAFVCLHAAPSAAQDEQALKSFFEGKRVTLKLDMPGSSDGVDLHVDSNRPLDYQQYGDRIRSFGTAIRSGESALVTLVKVKKDLIEFQLAGGGYGTFGEDTSTTVSMPLVERSKREIELEKAVREEDNPRERRELERELDELRDRRERENRRIEAARAEAEEQKRALLVQRRLSGGSRINLRYSGRVPSTIGAEDVMTALSAYVDFRALDSRPAPAAEPVSSATDRPAGDIALNMLNKGMTRAEVERGLGPAQESSGHREGSLAMMTLVFLRGDQRITADFVDDVLVRYAVTSR